MPDRPRPRVEPFQSDTTSQDVINFALARFARQLSLWGLACIQRDEQAMIRAVAEIRNIAVRMDRFRRITVKRWQAAAPANSETEKPSQ